MLQNQRIINQAKRLEKLPIYIFAEIAKLKASLDPDWLIDLSLGSPDSPTPDLILKSLKESSLKPLNHKYPPFDGKSNLKQGISEWLKGRFGFEVVEEGVLPLIGSKEGLAHLPLAYIDTGDISLIPDPHYPVHERGTLIAGGEVFPLPLFQSNQFLVDFEAIPASVAEKAKLMVLSYPNNPTGAIAEKDFYERAIAFCRKYNILLCHDLAYSELGFDDHKPTSIFEIMEFEEPAIEFYTFSKTYHMAGWRIGFCIGNPEIVQTLYSLKTNMDYGVCNAVQDAALTALSMPAEYYVALRRLYQERASFVVNFLREKLGWEVFRPGGAMYVWVPAPTGEAMTSVEELLLKAGLATTPGSFFGSEGDRYIRIALVQPLDKLQEAMQRLQDIYG
ncbi:MAG: aminotransferase class I/II-fold pyridoxal phosphate-dependent enzyme [Candidatus Caenarcaniphilales bacterium]|nr:aminotransferase class I/II-fold pyridoxal phosphate-dependent enzyme [Candidatus Caenarcaniphilales bacterium]